MIIRYLPYKFNETEIENESEKLHLELNIIALIIFNSEGIHFEIEFVETFKKLHIQCVADNYYWQYCPASVYLATFDERVNSWLNHFKDAKLSDFIQMELNDINEYFNEFRSDFETINDGVIVYSFLNDKWKICKLKCDSYFSEQITANIYYSTLRKLEYLQTYYEQSRIKEVLPIPSLDYSDNSNAEKIVFLNELGILEFLRNKHPQGLSTNKLAEVISAFTGINQTTVQSYLNPIYSKNVDPKNSPLTEKNLKSVHEKLVKMGFTNYKTI